MCIFKTKLQHLRTIRIFLKIKAASKATVKATVKAIISLTAIIFIEAPVKALAWAKAKATA
jgi:hypothetical protein